LARNALPDARWRTAGFADEELTAVEPPAGRKIKRRPVVFVPGFLGSYLYQGSQLIWPQPRIMFSTPEVMRLEEPLEPRGVPREVVIVPGLVKLDQYSLLVDYLTDSLRYESGSDLLEFATISGRTSGSRRRNWLKRWTPGIPALRSQ
jgi:hypothetical protein